MQLRHIKTLSAVATLREKDECEKDECEKDMREWNLLEGEAQAHATISSLGIIKVPV